MKTKKNKMFGNYFKNVRLTDNSTTAFSEIRSFLEKNGFTVARENISYVNEKMNSEFSVRKGHIYVATQIKTGKRIALTLDNRAPRRASFFKMEYLSAVDRKVIFVRDDENATPRSEISSYSEDIEIIYLPIKTEEELIQDKIDEQERIKASKLSSITNLKTDGQRFIYDRAVSYMLEMIEKYNQIPKFEGLAKRMSDLFPGTFSLLDPKERLEVLRQAHNDISDVRFKRK